MKQVITIDNGKLSSIVEDGKTVFSAAGTASPSTGGAASGGGTAPTTGGTTGYESEVAQMMRQHPISLNWRYASHMDLVSDIMAKNFNAHRTVLKKLDGNEIRLVAGKVPNDATPIRFIEQADGSVVYETYLNSINAQSTGKRTDILPAYNDRAEMLNDLKAIKFEQIVELDGVRVWPPADVAGFGPPLPYTTATGGGIVSGLNPDGSIIIEGFTKP